MAVRFATLQRQAIIRNWIPIQNYTTPYLANLIWHLPTIACDGASPEPIGLHVPPYRQITWSSNDGSSFIVRPELDESLRYYTFEQLGGTYVQVGTVELQASTNRLCWYTTEIDDTKNLISIVFDKSKYLLSDPF